MREIKFRGMNLCGSWVYGDLTHNRMRMPDGDGKLQKYISVCGEPVLLRTVGQYTGLKDSEGREIYEGDIVERDNSYFQKTCPTLPKTTVGVVEWKDGEFIVRGSYKLFSSSKKFPITVIGNVHDNPELLEAAHD